MKRIFIITLLLGILLPAAQAESPVIAAADSAYMADEYTKAVELYKQAISTEGPSAKLYYNLGNAYYRLGENGNAILSYERSLRLDPADKDARDNLDFVNARITDRPGGFHGSPFGFNLPGRRYGYCHSSVHHSQHLSSCTKRP